MWLHSRAMLSTESSFLIASVAKATPVLYWLEDMRRDTDNYNSKYSINHHSKKAFLNKNNSGPTLFVGAQPAQCPPPACDGAPGPQADLLSHGGHQASVAPGPPSPSWQLLSLSRQAADAAEA